MKSDRWPKIMLIWLQDLWMGMMGHIISSFTLNSSRKKCDEEGRGDSTVQWAVRLQWAKRSRAEISSADGGVKKKRVKIVPKIYMGGNEVYSWIKIIKNHHPITPISNLWLQFIKSSTFRHHQTRDQTDERESRLFPFAGRLGHEKSMPTARYPKKKPFASPAPSQK